MRLVKRSDLGWGSTGASYAKPTRGIVIHYDSVDQGLENKPHSACIAYWKRTRDFHRGPARQWVDIGYSWGACPHGYVFEGRGLNRAQAAQPSGNTTYYSVTLMSGPSEDPTSEQVNAVRELRAWLMDKGVGPLVKGHRDFYATSCPGDRLYRLVKNGTFARAPGAAPADDDSWTEDIVKDLPVLEVGDDCYDVKTLRGLLFARGGLAETAYGGTVGLRSWLELTVFDRALLEDVKAFQKRAKLKSDGVCGPKTYAALLRVS